MVKKNLKIVLVLFVLIISLTGVMYVVFDTYYNDDVLNTQTEETSVSTNDINSVENDSLIYSQGHIYLYGETHNVEEIVSKELEIWGKHYSDEDMRHLFIEAAYYTAELMNVWMNQEHDELIDFIFDNYPSHMSDIEKAVQKGFYKKIKSRYPETIFHGTDVGHQYDTIGEYYIDYLEEQGFKDSKKYNLAQENMLQGIKYYEAYDIEYREKMLLQNFVREYEELNGESVMGIYGAYHTRLPNKKSTEINLATDLTEIYGEDLTITDLTYEIATLIINDVHYMTEHYYKSFSDGPGDIVAIEQWYFIDNEDLFSDYPTWGAISGNFYSKSLAPNQVYRTDFTMKDGSVDTVYSRVDENFFSELSFAVALIDKEEDTTKKDFRTATIRIAEKDYKGMFLGARSLNGILDIDEMRFWVIEDAFLDFKKNETTGNYQPASTFPLTIEEKQIFVVDTMMINGEVRREYFRVVKGKTENFLYTEGIKIE